MRGRRSILFAFLPLTVLLAAGPFLYPLFSPWSRMNCRIDYVDIHSGRLRQERYLWWVPVYAREAETDFSRKLFPDGNYPEPDWRIDSCYDPYLRHSPHYAHHGTLWLLRQFENNDPALTEAELQPLRQRILRELPHGKPELPRL